MPRNPNPTVFPCGRGTQPGTQWGGAGGQQPTTSPAILVPEPTRDPDPPFLPPLIPPRKPRPSGPGPAGPGAGRPGRGSSGRPSGPTAAPPAGPARPGATGRPAGPTAAPPARPGQTGRPGGPTTGGPSNSHFKCITTFFGFCQGDEGKLFSEATLTTVITRCVPCTPNLKLPNGEVVPDSECIYRSFTECKSRCTSPTFTNLPCQTVPQIPSTQPTGDPEPGQTSDVQQTDPVITSTSLEPGLVTPLGDPVFLVPASVITSTSNNNPVLTSTPTTVPLSPGQVVTPPTSPSLVTNVTNQANQILKNQESSNATRISVDDIEKREEAANINLGIEKPTVFDPNLNFFKAEVDATSDLRSNNKRLDVFKDKIEKDISDILRISNTNASWNEVTLQNISDEKLLRSLKPSLINAFEFIRHPGGEPIGVTTLLRVVRKHILQGTLDEFDPSYYTRVANAQLNTNFDILETPAREQEANKLAISYLQKTLNTYQTNKPTEWRNFQINRVRPLNEDLNLEVPVTSLDGESKDIEITNVGFDVTKLNGDLFGKLNIGDGGGYYVSAEDTTGEGVPVYANSIIDKAFYAPASVRLKVLNMLDIDPAIKITATSQVNQHEFTASDSGASAIKPLFFKIDISSVSGTYTENTLVENYSATYSLLTESSDIQTHLNNNALNTPMLSIDYRDPIYRYILDTSSFTASLNDFDLKGFENKGLSSVGARFVRNIPFGFVVTPVAGGKYNPFNGNSTLDSHGSQHTRTLSVIPAVDTSVDEDQTTMFNFYFLNTEDGVDRVGIGEGKSTQNIGYRYNESDFTSTFYSASAGAYGLSSLPPSAQGTAYLLRESIDYLSSTYSSTTLTWYDVFSRMPVTRICETFYDSDQDLILEIANGLRGGVKVQNIENLKNIQNQSVSNLQIIDEDARTIITESDRTGITTSRL